MDRDRRDARALAAVLGCAGLLYFFLWARRTVGMWNDDALYLLCAKSLLQGRYAALEIPGEPLLTLPFPGFALFLAPFVALFEPHWIWTKLAPTAAALFLCWAAAHVSRPLLSQRMWFVFIALLAFHPSIVLFSGEVLSEPYFLALSLGALWMLGRPATLSSRLALAAFCGAAALTRPEGFLLIAAVAFGWAAEKKWRDAAFGSLLASIPALLFFLRNRMAADTVTGYAGYWQDRGGPQLADFASGFFEALRLLFLQTLLSLPGRLPAAIEIPLSLSLFTATLAGAFFLKQKLQRRIAVAAAFYFVSYFALHAIWPFKATRYYLLLLPPILAAVLALIEKGLEEKKGARVASAGALALLGLSVVGPDLWMIWERASGRVPAIYRGMPETMQRIREAVPEGSVLSAMTPSIVFLYTGRQAIGPPDCRSVDECRSAFRSERVTYILAGTRPLADPEVSRRWTQLAQIIPQSPEIFPLLAHHPQEGTWLYGVK
jgi:hypothetical protein